jgi:homoserine O-acetyltransferase
VYPTWYSGRHWGNEWLIGDGMALDPDRSFIIVRNMLGNGPSSSPSNTPPPYDRARFPHVTVLDNVDAQHRFVTERFGIERLVAVTGWSMGAGQTYQWAVSYPEMVPRILPFCGSARTSPHNVVFLEGVKAALTADAAWNHGWYETRPTRGLRAAARVYAGWGFSQAFYRDSAYSELGQSSLEDFLVPVLGGLFPRQSRRQQFAHETLDVAARRHRPDPGLRRLARARARLHRGQGHPHARREGPLLSARAQRVGGATHAERGAARDPPACGGHFAGGGANPVDTRSINEALKDLLASS